MGQPGSTMQLTYCCAVTATWEELSKPTVVSGRAVRQVVPLVHGAPASDMYVHESVVRPEAGTARITRTEATIVAKYAHKFCSVDNQVTAAASHIFIYIPYHGAQA